MPRIPLIRSSPLDALSGRGPGFVPPMSGQAAVSRPRLLARFVAAGARIVLVTAPPGFGKTTLMAQAYHAAASSGKAVAWLTVDESDNDAGAFRTRLEAAVAVAHPPSARRSGSTGLEAALEDLPDPSFVFLDDFHLIVSSVVQEAFANLLRLAPAHVRFVIGGRAVPDLPLGRLRLRGEVAEIRGEDLRFDVAEAASFFAQAETAVLSADQVASLNAHTEGWPAALRLAALSMQWQDDPGPILREISGRHRDIVDFLSEEVLRRQAEPVRDFLLATSGVPRFCPALCRALVDGADVPAILAHLERSHLFLVPLDAEREWFRYHQTFAEFLRAQLAAETPDRVASLHTRAADWFFETGDYALAIEQALAAGDMAKAGAYLDAGCEPLFKQGRLAALMDFTARIPPSEAKKFHRLQLMRVWALAMGWRFEDARRILSEVKSAIGDDGNGGVDPSIRDLAVHREMILAFVHDDVGDVEKYLQVWKAQHESADTYIEATLRNIEIFIDRERFSARPVDLVDVETRALYGTSYGAVWHASLVAPTYVVLGDLVRARDMLETAVTRAAQLDGGPSPLGAMPALLLADVAFETGDVVTARRLMERYIPYAWQLGIVDELVAGLVTIARLHWLAGAEREGFALLDQGEELANSRGFRRLRAAMQNERLRRLLLSGRRDDALAVARRDGLLDLPEAIAPGRDSTGHDEYRMLTWARLAIALGDAGDAVRHLRRWVRFLADRGYVRSALRAALLSASALAVSGDRGGALRAARQVVSLGHGGPFIATVTAEGPIIAGLLAEIGADAVDPDPAFRAYRARLLQAFPDKWRPQVAAADPAAGMAVEPLKPRELEVLRLAGRGLVNREIAAELGITTHTVKYHLKQVFQKLGVRRRSEALGRARALGFLA